MLETKTGADATGDTNQRLIFRLKSRLGTSQMLTPRTEEALMTLTNPTLSNDPLEPSNRKLPGIFGVSH
jgi:hypothetical protein